MRWDVMTGTATARNPCGAHATYHINLHDDNVLPRRLLVHGGRDPLARSAPRRREVDDHELIAGAHEERVLRASVRVCDRHGTSARVISTGSLACCAERKGARRATYELGFRLDVRGHGDNGRCVFISVGAITEFRPSMITLTPCRRRRVCCQARGSAVACWAVRRDSSVGGLLGRPFETLVARLHVASSAGGQVTAQLSLRLSRTLLCAGQKDPSGSIDSRFP